MRLKAQVQFMRSWHPRGLLCILVLCTFGPGMALGGALLDTYEVSYIYNSVVPDTSLEYDGVTTYPIQVSLAPGDYFLLVVEGTIGGNPANPTLWGVDDYWPMVLANNPGATEYDTGYNGGSTWPSGQPEKWRRDVRVHVGASIAGDPGIYVGGALGDEYHFAVGAGEDLWLYWNDNYIKDNLGGVTLELYRESSLPTVPIPGALLLGGLGTGLCAVLRRRGLLT